MALGTTFRCGHLRVPENTAIHFRRSTTGKRQSICRTCRHASVVRATRKLKSGWADAEYQAALRAQGGLCAICERPPVPGTSLHADHDHARPVGEGRRALLCHMCNHGLGSFGDSTALLLRAVEYLSNYGKERNN